MWRHPMMTHPPIFRGVNVPLLAICLALGIAAVSCTQDAPPPKSQINTQAILPDGLQMTQSGGGTIMMISPNLVTPSPPGQGNQLLPIYSQSPQRPNAASDLPNVATPPAPATPREEHVTPPQAANCTIFFTF